MMLNMALFWPDYQPFETGAAAPKKPTKWRASVTFGRQETILVYERNHMTISRSLDGSDAHGWRNALNYFGWGSIRAPVYRDESFGSFDRAAAATVSAIAAYRKPVGILAHGGHHAQIVTGYRVQGEDPRTGSTRFSVLGVYVTDPLRSDHLRDAYVPIGDWRSGQSSIRFTAYREAHATRVDPIDGRRGNDEWVGRWVTVAPAA